MDLLNKNNILNMAFILSVKVTFIFLTTAPSLYPNMIYKRLILTAVYYINLLVTIFDFYLILVLYSVSTTYKDKAITNTL